MKYEIDVLLATYNGEKYLEEQLESLSHQTISNWRLLIRDDCSSDSTNEIIEQYKITHRNVEIIRDNFGNVGPSKNFGILLENSNSNYVIFCDQDDIWDSNKLEILFNTMKQEEKNKPTLVHCDARTIDENNLVISNHFIGDRGLVPGIREILKSGVSQGSSMMLNRKIIELTKPLSKLNIMHDLYISLISECLGKRVYINQQLMSYRHHENNFLGKTRKFKFGSLHSVKNFLKKKSIITIDREQTIEEFLNFFSHHINEKDKKVILRYKYYINSDNSRIKRVYYLIAEDYIYSCGKNKYFFLLIRSLGILLGRY
jgi:glycosyltransferase involved in cell wall biosynthesis